MPTSADDAIITNAAANRTIEVSDEVLLRNDVGATAIASVTGATHANAKVGYTTPADFPANGGSFTYQATDGATAGNTATVTVTGVAGDTITGTSADDILVADATTATTPTTIGDFTTGASNLAWSSFGERPTGNIVYVAQTFTATESTAQNLRFALGGYSGSSAIEFRVRIVTSDGTGTDFQGGPNFSPGQILFTSGQLVLPANAGETEFNVALNGLTLTPGQLYAFVLDPVVENGSEGLGTAIPRGGLAYTGGDSFVLSVPSNSGPANQAAHFAGNWTRVFNTDLAFEMRFGPAPVRTTLDGLAGNDSLVGDFGAETLLGGGGEDWLYGLAGDDRLEGGADDDRADGGAGNDRIVYRIGEGVDTVDGGAELLGGRDTLEVRNETGTARGIRIGTISTGAEIDPNAADIAAVNRLDGLVQVRAAGSSDAFVDAVRFDEIENVAVVLGAGDRVTVDDILGTAVSHNLIAITGAAGNEIVDVIAGRRLAFEGGAGSGDMLRLDGRWSDYEIRTETRNGELWYRLTPTATGALAGRPIAVEAHDVEQFYFLGDDATIGTDTLLWRVPLTKNDTGGPVVEAGRDAPGTPSATGNVLTNDTDANTLDAIRVVSITAGTPGPNLPENVGTGETAAVGRFGTLYIQANGAWRYELDNSDPDTDALTPAQTVADVFTYLIRDLTGLPALGTLTVSVQGARDENRPPTNTNDNLWDWGEDDGAFPFFAGDFDAGFTDVDGDTLAAIRITALPDPAHGTLMFNGVAAPADNLPFVIPFDEIEGNDESQGLWFVPANRSADYSAVLEFQSQDSFGDWSVASNTYTIRIDADNDAPSGVTLAANTVDENAANGTEIGALAALDPDGDVLTWTLHDSAGGRFAVDPNSGVVTVAAGNLLNYEGQQSYAITVSASDGTLSTGQTQVTIQLNDVNEAPSITFTTNSQAGGVREEAPSTQSERGLVNLFDDDIGTNHVGLAGPYADLFLLDPIGNSGTFILYFRAGTVPDYETLTAYTVTVTVDDPTLGDGPEDSFDVTVPVNAVDETAITAPRTITVDEDGTYVFTVADFPYTDPEGERSLTAVDVTGANNATLWYDPDGGDRSNAIAVVGERHVLRAAIEAGQLFFTPDADESGTPYGDFRFNVADSQGRGQNTVAMTINVTAVNDAPVWSNAGQVEYLENATSPLNHNIAIADVELDALNGGLGDYSGASLTVTRDGGADPADVFGFDPSGATFTVVGNELRTLAGDTFATFATSGGTITVDFANAGAIPTPALVDDVLRHISYHNDGDDLPDELDFRWAFDDGNSGAQGSGAGVTEVVTDLDVRAVNDPPLNTVPSTQSVEEDTVLVFGAAHGNTIRLDDPDASDEEVRFSLRVEHGTLTVGSTNGLTVLAGNGSSFVELRGAQAAINAALDGLTYRADANFIGDDTLTVTSDDAGHSGMGDPEQDTDTVTITVTAVNDPPEAVSDSVSGDEDTAIAVTLSGTDSDGAVAFFRIGTLPLNGALFLDAAGDAPIDPDNIPAVNGEATVYFIPAGDFSGQDSVEYLAVDDEGLTSASLATISITVTAVNDAPELGGGLATTVQEGGTVTITTDELTASDPDNDPEDLVYTITAFAHGVVIVGNAVATSFTQADLMAGRVRFGHDGNEDAGSIAVSLTDGESTPQSATVTIAVDPRINDVPALGGAFGAFVEEGGRVTITPFELTAIDPDNAPAELVYTVTATAHGNVLVDNAAATTFTQADLEAGLVAFEHDGGEDAGSITLSLTDGTVVLPSFTIAIAINPPVDDAPEAQDGSASGDEDTVISGTAIAIDIDTAPDDLTYALVGDNGGALHGSVAMNADGSYSYTPHAGFNGTDSFQFQASDATGTSNAATITIDVAAVDDAAAGAVSGSSLAYTENQAPTAIDPLIVVTDPDSTDLVGATVAITGGFAAGEDVLGFTHQNGITGTFDPITGVLTLSGTSSVANYQAALRSVTYFNSSDEPSVAPRSVAFAVDDGTSVANLGGVGVTVLAVPEPALNDFTGDGRSDIFWRDANGTLVLWEMDGPTIVANHTVGGGAIPGYWHILDIADFNGDGESDVLWRDDAGVVVVWEMDGPTIVANHVLAGTPEFGALPDHWRFAGVGDFDRDGDSDVLWRDDAGTIVLWEMEDATLADSAVVGTLGDDWQVAEIGDFSGDGASDILWRHDDGTVRLWGMDGATVATDTELGTLPDYWHIADSGDYDGDGRSDVLWRDDAGTLVMWRMDGPNVVDNFNLGAFPDYWHVVESGDYNGDGNADILWRDDAGTLVLWEMNGPNVLANTSLGAMTTEWTIV